MISRAEWRYWRIALFLSSVAVAAGGVVVAVKAVESSTRDALCPLVTTLVDAWKEEPPPSASGRNVAEAVDGLRRRYNCP